MFSLLPEKQRKQVKLEYTLRLSVTILVSLVVAMVVSVAFLLPSYFLASIKADVISEQVAVLERHGDESDYNELESFFKQTRSKIILLDRFKGQRKVSNSFSKILEYKTDDIEISSLSLVSLTDEAAEININGVARDRESLVSFTKSIDQEDVFSGVTLPVSNFAESSNIGFSLSISSSLP